jgi:hypothetical protein
MARLDLDTAAQKLTLQARLPFNPKTIALMLDMNNSGSEVLSPTGRKVLAEMEGAPFQKVASRFKMHKRRVRQPKKGKLEACEKNAGDVLDTDDYPTPHLKNCPSTQVISDPAVKVGWPYRNKHKSDLVHHAQEHFSNFVMPHVLRGDFAKQNHFGDNRIMCRGRAVQLKSTTPCHQWQHGGERYMFQLLNMSTCLMLDSQLPEALTVEVAEHAALLLMISPVQYKGLMTTGHKVYFQTDYNLTMLKRLGCLVYYRLEKKERKRFGQHGALAVHIGLNGFKFPDFTCKLYMPHSRQVIYRRGVLFAEDYMPFREGRGMLSTVKDDHWIRPGVGALTRSVLREATCDESLGLNGVDDKSLVYAATNLANEPTSWMQLSSGGDSAVRVDDVVAHDFEDHRVVSVTPNGVKLKSMEENASEPVKTLDGKTEYYLDTANLIAREPRKRTARTLFTFTPKARQPKKQDPHGLGLMGLTFMSTPEGSKEQVEYTVTKVGDPRLFMKSKKPVPTLEHKETSKLGDKDAETHLSKVSEIREWMRSTEQHLKEAMVDEDLGTSEAEAVLCPLLLVEPIKLKIAKTVEEPRKPHPTVLRGFDPDNVPIKIKVQELLLRGASTNRKAKRFKRSDIISMLKGKIPKRQYKWGIDTPLNYPDAHSATRKRSEIEAWTTEENEEMQTLDEYFEKGLDIAELRKTLPNLKPITGMWVYDAHPEGVKSTTHRARFVANGARDPEKGQHDSYNPVAQLANARIALAIIAQLKMDLVIAGISKACWKGRFNRTNVHTWAAPGFSKFDGEVWKVLAPINGLDDSGHTFYQTVSEFMRMMGYKHHHSDPCFFRRLRGPGVRCQCPEHTDCPTWRREAPNEDFNPHHVQMINPKETNALPHPNVLQTADPTHYKDVAMASMSDEEVAQHQLSDADFMDVIEQLFKAKSGEERTHYYELALWCVDDFMTGTHDKDTILEALQRRFGKITMHINGGMFLGHDVEYDTAKSIIILRLRTYMERVMEAMVKKGTEDMTLNSNVGILNWATSCVFGTHQKEARVLASAANLELQEDLETSIALIYEIYERRDQGIHFREYKQGKHAFVPRTSRVERTADVSSPHRVRSLKPGAVLVTKDDMLQADDGYNVHSEDPNLHGFDEELMPCTPLFHLMCWTDASCAPRGENGRSEIYFCVQLNGAPVMFNPITLSGVADSASTAEHCGASIGCKQTEGTRQTLRFAGVAVNKVGQYIDATSAKQIAENPKKLGSTRHLGIRWHLVRYHLHAKDVQSLYSITNDCLADMGTKRLARKMLDRFARIFFNCLAEDWDLDYEELKHICGDGVFMDGTVKTPSQATEDDDDGAETEEERGRW